MTSAQDGTDGTYAFSVPTYGTYLLADSWETYGPSGGHQVAPPLIIDLEAIGVESGDIITVSYSGILYENAYWDGTLGDYIDQTDESEFHIYGVFSSTSQLLPITERNRVPGAIQTDASFHTANAWYTQRETDIPEDFRILPYTKGVCFASTTAVEIGVIYPGFCKNSVKYGWVLWEVAGSHQHLNPLK
jgi:hypothetical protein